MLLDASHNFVNSLSLQGVNYHFSPAVQKARFGPHVSTKMNDTLFSALYTCSSGWLTIHYGSKDDCKVLILLSPPPRCWDHRHAPSCSSSVLLPIKPRAPCTLGKQSTDRASPQTFTCVPLTAKSVWLVNSDIINRHIPSQKHWATLESVFTVWNYAF